MSKRDVFKVLGCEGEPPLRRVTLEAWLQEEDACEYVPGSTVTLEFIGRQMPDPEMTQQAAPQPVVNTREGLLHPTDVSVIEASQVESEVVPSADDLMTAVLNDIL